MKYESYNSNVFSRGQFVISIDFEYAWGFVDRDISNEQKEKIKQERDIVERLLHVFEKYDIPATWAIVGKLLEQGSKDKEKEIWSDTDDLILKINQSLVGHEIGSHSYTHPVYTNISRKEAQEDIENVISLHTKHNLPTYSFIFPRNEEKYHDLLHKHGFSAFRTSARRWYDGIRGPLNRLSKLVDYLLPTARVSLPYMHSSGLVAFPDSMLLDQRKGVRKIVASHLLFSKARRGIDRAAKEKKMFHLWFHPSNFSYSEEAQFQTLDKILAHASKQREKGVLNIATMRDVARDLEESHEQA